MKSLDSETTGLDIKHGARPFFVTVCDENYNLLNWLWRVDPLTRQPIIPQGDIEEIREVINSEKDAWVLQNTKFDVSALNSIGVFNEDCQWPWHLVKDTLIAGHLLASNQPHDLTTMALVELGINIKPYEENLKEAVNEARRIARSKYPEWKIAKRGLEGMPSAKDSVWQYDMWLPLEVAIAEGYPLEHPWYNVLVEYSNADSSVTLPLLKKQLAKLEARGLTKIYETRLKLLPIAYQMESHGITINKERAYELHASYSITSKVSHDICVNLSEGKLESLPVNGASNALREVVFNHFGLVASKTTPKGEPSLDKAVLDTWLETLPKQSKAYLFVKNLRAYRRRKTAMSFIESYEGYWIPLDVFNPQGEQCWCRMYPSLNITGTHTLRWSSQNPNEQQFSKQEIEEINETGDLESHNARYMLGPLPDEEWWSCDAQNIERRIPAYEANEEAIIELLERPNDPPYFGSEHSMVAHIIHPKEFSACKNEQGDLDGRIFKKKYSSTLYQWTKNFNFALQYGCQETKGDATAHVQGAYKKVKARFNKQEKLNQYWIDFSNKHGYVETIPDKTVDPARGYPLLCERTRWGKVSPTVPLSFHIQGTAMWWMGKAMIRCQSFLEQLNSNERLFQKIMLRFKTEVEKSKGFRMIMQVHDELVFCFPKGKGKEPQKTYLPIIRELQKLMAQGGQDIGVPTPVGIEYHPNNWGEGITINA